MSANRIRVNDLAAGLAAAASVAPRAGTAPLMPSPPTLLSDLPTGARASVRQVRAPDGQDALLVRRLQELGFLPGEPVRLVRRGPGGREPLAVQVGETLFALRKFEAQCVEVDLGATPQPRGPT